MITFMTGITILTMIRKLIAQISIREDKTNMATQMIIEIGVIAISSERSQRSSRKSSTSGMRNDYNSFLESKS